MPSVPDPTELLWSFKIGGLRRIWDWGDGAPDPKVLEPVRRPHAAKNSSHNPVEAWSLTTATRIRVESGLEFDHFRELDRDPNIKWIVAQPLALTWPGPRRKSSEHTPDFLTIDAGGVMTVWDVRHPDRVNDQFQVITQLTDAACAGRGIGYEVFTGLGMTRKVNLNWIDSYRNKPVNLAGFKPIIEEFVGRGCLFGELLEHVGHYGIPVVWHLVWSCALRVDLDSRITPTSPITPWR